MGSHLELVIVRHGQTDANKMGVYLGRSDVPLNCEGRKQAHELRGRLAGAQFDAVYASPLSRCVETARIIAPDYACICLDGLMELDFGEWEGKHYEEVQRIDPAGWLSWTEMGLDGAPSGGESMRMMHDRVVHTIYEIVHRHEKTGGRILLVSHGGTIRKIAAWAVGLDVEGMWRFFCDPGSLQRIVVDSGYAFITQWNQT